MHRAILIDPEQRAFTQMDVEDGALADTRTGRFRRPLSGGTAEGIWLP
jgi:hypothetical protein